MSDASVYECVSLFRFSVSDAAVCECVFLFRFSVSDAAVYECVSLFRFSVSDAAVYECVSTNSLGMHSASARVYGKNFTNVFANRQISFQKFFFFPMP